MGNEILFEGKKYISARRASQISGYNSDYIGQLCRKGSLDCKLVGRTWFVNENSLVLHKEEAAKTPRGRMPISHVVSSDGQQNISGSITKAADTVLPVDSIPVTIQKITSPAALILKSIPSEFIPEFNSQDRDAFKLANSYSESSNNFGKKIATICVVIILFVLSSPFLMRSDTGEKAVMVYEAGNKIALEINKNTSKQLASLSSSAKELGIVFFSDQNIIHEWRVRTHALTLNVYHRLSLLPSTIFDTAGNMKKLVMRDSDSEPVETASETPEQASTENIMKGKGITVVPSTGDMTKDEKVKQYIKNSFSDETKVVPDASGESGIIKPIFKKHTDSDYLYVIVPVKE